MWICRSFEELSRLDCPLHLALGVFDGVHIGHQAVIQRAIDAARDEGGIAGLLTFDPHPIRVIAPAKAPASLLSTLDHKQRIIERLGVGLLAALRFDADMAAMPAEEFIERLMRADVRTLAVGEDWRFGHQRRGDVAMLNGLAGRYGYRLEAVAPVMFEQDRVSSTRIRQAIRDGNLAAAEQMLGRRYSVSGIVEQGRQLGRTIGFPTANIATGDSQLPPRGVWAVTIAGPDGVERKGVANLGSRPTVSGQEVVLEVHVLDFSGDLYGCVMEVVFHSFLRPECKFDSLEFLREQIVRDVDAARHLDWPSQIG